MIELENALVEVIANITGLNPNNGEIRVAYADNPGPSWKHTDNVVTLYLTPVSASPDQDFSEELKLTPGSTTFNRKTFQTQVIDVNLSIYGPSCRELANRLRVLVQKEDLRRPLTSIKAFPVLKTPPATYVPYEHNKQWWQRTDMTLTFNWQTELVESVNQILSASVRIFTEKGEHTNANTTS